MTPQIYLFPSYFLAEVYPTHFIYFIFFFYPTHFKI